MLQTLEETFRLLHDTPSSKGLFSLLPFLLDSVLQKAADVSFTDLTGVVVTDYKKEWERE